MNRISKALRTFLVLLTLMLMLAGTFAWYFRADLLVDLSAWWAACVPG